MTAADVKLYSLQELADILRVSRQTIYNHLNAGHIQAVKQGKEYRVTEEEVQRILKNGLC